MQNYSYFILLFILFCDSHSILNAQNYDFPLVRTMGNSEIWCGLQLRDTLDQGSVLFAHVQLRNELQSSGFRNYQTRLEGGYEQKFTDHWRAGASVRHNVLQGNNYEQRVRGYLRHQSLLFANIQFWKEMELAYLRYSDFRTEQLQMRFMLALWRDYYFDSAGRHFLRTSFSYELFRAIDLEPRNIDRRFFNRGRWRGEVMYPLLESVHIGLFGMYHTNYYIALAQFDSTGKMTVPDRRLNINQWIWGLDLHLIF
ncbi:MAG: hypothetical protein JJT94_17255 [Bernardetiaceae bacterium]|nr:hypothetical protein [Bernardetiaceae bacterium]